MNFLNKSNEKIFLLFKNIFFYINLSLRIIRKPSKLLRHLLKRERNLSFYPKPFLYFFSNIVLVVIIKLLSSMSADKEKQETLTISLSNINTQTADFFLGLIGYVLGAAIFSLLLKRNLFSATSLRLNQYTILRAVCFASAIFVPLAILGEFSSYIFSFFQPENLLDLSNPQAENILSKFFFALLIIFLIGFLLPKIWWIFLICQGLLLTKYKYIKRVVSVVCIIGFCNILIALGPAIPKMASTLLIANSFEKYEESIDLSNINLEKAQLISMQLAFNKTIPEGLRYKMAMSSLSYYLFLQNPDNELAKYASLLALTKDFTKLEEVLPVCIEKESKSKSGLLESEIYNMLWKQINSLKSSNKDTLKESSFSIGINFDMKYNPFSKIIILTP